MKVPINLRKCKRLYHFFNVKLWLIALIYVFFVQNLLSGCRSENPSYLNPISELEALYENEKWELDKVAAYFEINDREDQLIAQDSFYIKKDKNRRTVAEKINNTSIYYYQYDEQGRQIAKFLRGSDSKIVSWKNIYLKDTLLQRIDYYTHPDSVFLWKDFSYDSLGNLLKETHYQVNTDTLSPLGSNLYFYEKGKRISQIKVRKNEKNTGFDSTYIYFEYDSLQRLSKKITLFKKESTLSNQEHYFYNKGGKLVEIKKSGLMAIRANIAEHPFMLQYITYDWQGQEKEITSFWETTESKIPYTKTVFTYKKKEKP